MDRFASDGELDMDVVALPFGLMGFVFGIIAFNQAASASAKIAKLEERLIEAGVLEAVEE